MAGPVTYIDLLSTSSLPLLHSTFLFFDDMFLVVDLLAAFRMGTFAG